MIQEVLVAVYGSLRRGMGNHRLLVGFPLLSTERVKGWDMYSYGAFPYITPSEDGEITIEVYAVPIDELLGSLDSLEGYPSFYDRKKIQTSKGEAWIYFIDQGSNSAPVESCDWVSFKGAR